MTRLLKILAAVQMLSGAAAFAADRSVVIEAPRGERPAKEVYAIGFVGGREETRHFDASNSRWSGSLPVRTSQLWAVRVDYPSPLSPISLKLELLLNADSDPIALVLPRPRQRADCHADDETELSRRTRERAGSRDALGIIIQIDHLTANRTYPCPPTVAKGLRDLRDNNLRYLRQRIPAIRSM